MPVFPYARTSLPQRALAAARAAVRFALNPRFRFEVLTRFAHGGRHFQGETTTLPDRFPALFAACRDLLAENPAPALLSFGCSTGEEVFSLARYLPTASITGVDINRWALRKARAGSTDPRIRFLHRLSPGFAALGGLDAIFCMAVFQRTEHRTGDARKASGFTFALFEQELGVLDGKLKPGGLLFLDHADFAFEDTALADRYTPVHFARSLLLRERPLFGTDNTLKAETHMAQRCFRKRMEP